MMHDTMEHIRSCNGCGWCARVWSEYDSAAEWCATRGLTGRYGDRLPSHLSTITKALIDDDLDAFQERVRGTAYAAARQFSEDEDSNIQ